MQATSTEDLSENDQLDPNDTPLQSTFGRDEHDASQGDYGSSMMNRGFYAVQSRTRRSGETAAVEVAEPFSLASTNSNHR